MIHQMVKICVIDRDEFQDPSISELEMKIEKAYPVLLSPKKLDNNLCHQMNKFFEEFMKSKDDYK